MSWIDKNMQVPRAPAGTMLRSLSVLLAFLVTATATLSGQSASPNGPAQGFVLQPGDVIRVEIWREPDLSGEFLVNEWGVVTFPLLGDREATTIPIEQLRDSLLAEYRSQLRNPSITITPYRRVNLLGEVNRPGLYPLDPTVSLAGAVAMAGGTTPLGDLNRIRIIRDGQVLHPRVSAYETLHTVNIRSGDQIVVDRRSWADRNSAMLLGTGLSVAGSIVTTLIILSVSNR
jgi:protein involved in polysaccharide export with SLBB domain